MSAVVQLAVPKTLDHVMDRLHRLEERFAAAHAKHLGYPYNLSGLSAVPEKLRGFLVNNLGDPYAGSHYASEVCDLEREAVQWLMRTWGCEDLDQYWGSIGASGTEGNLWSLYLAREALPGAILVYSSEAHYSIPKSARILGIKSICVSSKPTGEIDLAVLADTLKTLKESSVIIALTCGTTFKGAHDDVGGAIQVLDSLGIEPARRYIHLDGALNAMVLPFIDNVPQGIRPSFSLDIDSISTSGHKMIGTPMPCGVLVARRRHVERIASAISYLRSNDTTLMGSRNGHAVLAIWARLFGHGKLGYQKDVARSLKNAKGLCSSLQKASVPAKLNPLSLTVWFPQPSEAIVKAYQLACNEGMAHAIAMPNVSQDLMESFTTDYLKWFDASCKIAGGAK